MSDETKQVTVVGGPIAMKGYEFIVLSQDHRTETPDGLRVVLPKGTKLYMLKAEEVGVEYATGTAEKV